MAKLTIPELDPALPRIGYWRAFKAAALGPLDEPNPYAQGRFTWCTKQFDDDKPTEDGFCHHLYSREVWGFADGKQWLRKKLIIECQQHELVFVPSDRGYIGYYKCNHCPLTTDEYEARNHSQAVGT